MDLLGFFFTNRYTRFDLIPLVIATILYSQEQVGIIGAFVVLFGGFALGGIGEHYLARRERRP